MKANRWFPGIGVALLLCSASVNAESVRRVNWTGEPIKIELGVNQERRITFPSDIFVEYDKVTDPALQRIRIQIVKNTAYLKATSSVPSSRLIIGEISSQKRYLLDVKAVQTSQHHPRVVVEDNTNTANSTARRPAALIISEASCCRAVKLSLTNPRCASVYVLDLVAKLFTAECLACVFTRISVSRSTEGRMRIAWRSRSSVFWPTLCARNSR